MRPHAGSFNRERNFGGAASRLAVAKQEMIGTMRFSTTCLSLICAVQIGILYSQVVTNVSPYYPVAFDQLRYLNEAYKLGDAFIQQGVLSVARELLSPYSPNGFLLSLEGGLATALTGAHRTAALSVNIILLVVSQCTLFFAVRRAFSEAAAWCAVTLFLLTATPFLGAGGVFDFRIDFSAFCLFGIWACTVLLSKIYLERNISLLAGFVAGWLVLTRFITFVYLGAIMGLVVAVLGGAWIIYRDPRMKVRCLNATLSGAVIVTMFAPFFFINARMIYNYYFVSLFVSSEAKIRALEFGVDSPLKHLLFYPNSLLFDHLGRPFLLFAGACLAGSAIRHYLIHRDFRYDWSRHRAAICLLICVVAVPFAFLNLSASKSPLIISVIAVPVILLIAVVVDTILGRTPDADRFVRWQTKAVAAICVGIGLSVFLFRAAAPKCHLGIDACLAVNDFNDAIIKYARNSLDDAPVFSSDSVNEMINYLTLADRAYEQPGSPLNFRPEYDMQIFAPTKEDLLMRFSRSDVVVLSDPHLGRNSVYPSNAVISQNWQDLSMLVTKNMISLARTNIAGVPYEAFVKPAPKIAGLSGGWITSAGIDLRTSGHAIADRPFIVLEGPALLAPLGGNPEPRAELRSQLRTEPPTPLPARIAISDNRYKIVIDCSGACARVTEPTIHLDFDRFFVPAKVGINADTRELVLYAPSTRALAAQE
jgi:hypothetical protein